ncbi:MAG: IS630 family transposase, partial [Alphaproteobacteria bacterium]
AYIRRTYGQYFSRSGAIKLLHRLGFEYSRPKLLPAEADEGKQRDFIEKYEALQHNLADDEVIYFADAVHPEHQSRPAHGWIRKGDKVALKRNSGRKRVNIHGAVNLENFHCPVVEADRINADSTIALFEKLEAENRDKRCIHVILDNARYHHARAVKDWMKRTKSRINLIFLPAYAPHLNAIERLWGVMHKYVTHNSFYSTYKQFAGAILAFFSRTVPNEWPKFRDTVTDNFRIISFQDFRVLE